MFTYICEYFWLRPYQATYFPIKTITEPIDNYICQCELPPPPQNLQRLKAAQDMYFTIVGIKLKGMKCEF